MDCLSLYWNSALFVTMYCRPLASQARFRVLHRFWLAPLSLWLHSHKELPMVAVLAAWSLTYCFFIFGRLVGISHPSIVIHDSCISMCLTLIHVSEEWVVIINTIISLLISVACYDFGSSIIHKRLSFFLQWSHGCSFHFGMTYLPLDAWAWNGFCLFCTSLALDPLMDAVASLDTASPNLDLVSSGPDSGFHLDLNLPG